QSRTLFGHSIRSNLPSYLELVKHLVGHYAFGSLRYFPCPTTLFINSSQWQPHQRLSSLRSATWGEIRWASCESSSRTTTRLYGGESPNCCGCTMDGECAAKLRMGVPPWSK